MTVRQIERRHYWTLALLIVGLVALSTVWYWNYTQDDVFITYTYSRNIASGKGFVFNEGQRVLGTTAPLYALIMAGAYRLTPDLLHAGNLLSAVGVLAIVGLTFWIGRRLSGFWLGAAAAVLLAANPILYISFGMETLVYTTLLLAAFALALKEREVWTAVVLGLLTLVRADGMIATGVLGLAALVHQQRIPWRGVVAYSAVIAPWFIFATLYFGAPFPNTLAAKADYLGGLTFLRDGWGWWADLYWKRGPVFWLALPMLVVATVYAIRKGRVWLLVLGWAALYALGYTILNTSAFWYYTPLLPALTLGAGLGGLLIWQRMRDAAPSYAWIAPVLIVAWALGSNLWNAYVFRNTPQRINTYELVGRWIDANTEPDAEVVLGDLGVVGYHAQRTMIDNPGLIVPNLYSTEPDYTTLKYRPDYLVTTQYFSWVRMVEQAWFAEHFVPLAGLSSSGDFFSPMTVYQRADELTPLAEATYAFGDYTLRAGIPEKAITGGRLALTLELVAPAGTQTQIATGTCIVNAANGEVVATRIQPLLEQRYPAPQTLGAETLLEVVPVSLPTAVTPGDYQVHLSNAPLPLDSEAPDCSADVTYNLGTFTVQTPEHLAGYATLDGAEFGGVARLLAVALPDDIYWSGGSLPLSLYWEGLMPDQTNYTVYAHLVDEGGRVWAQIDSYPRNGTSLTSTWQAGQRVLDMRRINLPPDLPPGDYTFRVGLYNLDTQERLTLPDGDDGVTPPITVTIQWPGGDGLPDNF